MLTQNTGIPKSTYHKIHRNTFYFFICETLQMYHMQITYWNKTLSLIFYNWYQQITLYSIFFVQKLIRL